MLELQPFQRRFIAKATDPKVDTAALSLPRGNGKSWLAAHLLIRALTPGDPLHVPGSEYLLCAGSIEQARLCFRFIRAELEPTGHFRWLDSSTRIGIKDKRDDTRLRVLSSNAKTSMGIVGCPLLIADEPGSWETVGGQLMADAILTAMGKPGSPMRVVFIGTLSPAVSGWWHDLIAGGTHGSTYVQSLVGDPEQWDTWKEVARCNPLTRISAEFRKKLRAELAAAQSDSRLKARFMSYRLNVPSGDDSQMLLSVDDWKMVVARPVAERVGKPLVGVDLGQGRAFSAAVGIWKTGRIEAVAVCPGIPSVEAQEVRDRVPRGTYQQLVDGGQLRVAEGYRVPPVRLLVEHLTDEWGTPAGMLADRFRESELRDNSNHISIEGRVVRWSEAAADIRSLRRLCRDGGLSCAEDSRALVAAGLSVAQVKSDDQGNTRLVKTKNNVSRDDVPAALLLAAGAFDRALSKPKRGALFRGVA